MRAVDLFAGWGGASEGMRQAGVEVVWAANHWPLAVQAHERNHPNAVHVCQDLRQADWTQLPAYDLLWASPACQGHSSASRPRRNAKHDAMRATAWAVIDCAEVTRPAAVVVENVLSFERWQLFPLWRQALVTLGYHVQERVLVATNHGVPQRRARLFIVATLAARFDLAPAGIGPEPAFGPCLEPDAAGWRPVAKAMPGARDRIRRAQGISGRRCLVQHTTGHPGVPLDEPIRTITTQDHWILVDGDDYRPLTLREYARGMGFPDSYQWPEGASRGDVIKGFGNAVVPAQARDIVLSLGASSSLEAA